LKIQNEFEQSGSNSHKDNPAVFHQCPKDPTCPYCNGFNLKNSLDWSFLDSAYCISLKSRTDRTAMAAAQFHKFGLCQKVIFYRPSKHPKSVKQGIWESHRAVAINALEHGCNRTLIMEDDVLFLERLNPNKIKELSQEIETLPANWNIFYLGHWPLWLRFINRNVVRTQSVCAHSYIASSHLLNWLTGHPYESSTKIEKAHKIFGTGIDSAYCKLDGTYALFPMLAIQNSSKSDNVDSKKRKKTLRHYIRHSKHREWLLSNLMRPNELFIALMSIVVHTLKEAISMLTWFKKKRTP
jgi:GR25 family glycosyltransferase involved in LPS biosynthesis